MFNYKMIYEISEGNFQVVSDKDGKYSLSVSEPENSNNFCLLIPELIEDTFKKIKSKPIEIKKSSFRQNGIFANGYCIFCDGDYITSIIRDDGSFVENLPANVKHANNYFGDNRLLVTIDGSLAYIDGLNNKIYYLPEEYQNATLSNYSCGYAVVTDHDKFFYLDKDFKKAANKEFVYASSFMENRALVCTPDEWQIINRDFKIFLIFSRNKSTDRFFIKAIREIQKELEAKSEEMSPSAKITNPYFYQKISMPTEIHLDKDTALSIFAPAIAKDIAKKLELVIPTDLEPKKQLVWVISEAAKKGTFIYDIKNGNLTEVELRTGIEIRSDEGCIRSFDENDVSFLRKRVKQNNTNK